MDVDAVAVVFGRYSGDGLEGGAGVGPAREGGHAGGVVDDEDGVVGAEELVLVFADGDPGAAGGGAGGGPFGGGFLGAAEGLAGVGAVGPGGVEGGVAAADFYGLRVGAQLGARGAGVIGGAVAVEEGVLLRLADGHFGGGVGDVLLALVGQRRGSGVGRGGGVGRGRIRGERRGEERACAGAAGLLERGRRRRGCGYQGSARRCQALVYLRPTGRGEPTAPAGIASPPAARNYNRHRRARRR